MFYRCLLNPFGSLFLLVSLCLYLVSVSKICPLLWVGCRSLPLLLHEVQCVLWALIKFFYECCCLCIISIECSELRVHLGWFFFWPVWSVLPYLFWDIWLKVDFKAQIKPYVFMIEVHLTIRVSHWCWVKLGQCHKLDWKAPLNVLLLNPSF